ncbi:hypothetical protein CR513_60357, partial [Mucuna pruriens]
MVGGLPQLGASPINCVDCFTSKQHRNPISKNSEQKEVEASIKCLQTDRRGEFNFLNFKSFCEEGIKCE